MSSFLSQNLEDLHENEDSLRNSGDFKEISDAITVEHLKRDLSRIKILEQNQNFKDGACDLGCNLKDQGLEQNLVDQVQEFQQSLEDTQESAQYLEESSDFRIIKDLERNLKDQCLKGDLKDQVNDFELNLEEETEEAVRNVEGKDHDLKIEIEGDARFSEQNIGHKNHSEQVPKITVSIAENRSVLQFDFGQNFKSKRQNLEEDLLKIQALNPEAALFARDLISDLLTRHPFFSRKFTLASFHPNLFWRKEESSHFTDDVGKSVMLIWHELREGLHEKFRDHYSYFLRGSKAFQECLENYCSVIRETTPCPHTLHAVIMLSAVLLEWIAFLYNREAITSYVSFYLYYWHFMFQILAKDEFFNEGGWHGLTLLARQNASNYDKIAHEIYKPYWPLTLNQLETPF